MPQHIPIHDDGDEIEIRIDGFRPGAKGKMRRTIKQLVNARLKTKTEEHRHEQILRNPPQLERMKRGRLTFRTFRKLLEWDDVVFLWKFEKLTADDLPDCKIHVHCESATETHKPLTFPAQDFVKEHLIELSLAETLGALMSFPEVDEDDFVRSLQFILRCPGGGPRGKFIISQIEADGAPDSQPLDPPEMPISQVPTGA